LKIAAGVAQELEVKAQGLEQQQRPLIIVGVDENEGAVAEIVEAFACSLAKLEGLIVALEEAGYIGDGGGRGDGDAVAGAQEVLLDADVGGVISDISIVGRVGCRCRY
jgi:hypothetical protein